MFSSSMEGMDRNKSHITSKWLSISRPPRMVNPICGYPHPSQAPPGTASRSNICTREPSIWASRIR